MLCVAFAVQSTAEAEGPEAKGCQDLACSEVVELGGQLWALRGQQAHHQGKQTYIPAFVTPLLSLVLLTESQFPSSTSRLTGVG